MIIETYSLWSTPWFLCLSFDHICWYIIRYYSCLNRHTLKEYKLEGFFLQILESCGRNILSLILFLLARSLIWRILPFWRYTKWVVLVLHHILSLWLVRNWILELDYPWPVCYVRNILVLTSVVHLLLFVCCHKRPSLFGRT